MTPRYITIVGGTPKVVPLDNDIAVFNVSVRTDATTIEFCLEDPDDSVAPNTFSPAVGPGPTWLAAPAPVNGVVVLNFPCAAVRLSKATNGVATVLQQGVI